MAGNAEHHAKLAIAKVEIAEYQRKDQGFESRLSVIDAVSKTDQRQCRGGALGRMVPIAVMNMVMVCHWKLRL